MAKINTRERKARFPADDILRKAGWEIVARPANSEAIWILKHRGEILKKLPESEAIAYCDKAMEKYAEFVK